MSVGVVALNGTHQAGGKGNSASSVIFLEPISRPLVPYSSTEVLHGPQVLYHHLGPSVPLPPPRAPGLLLPVLVRRAGPAHSNTQPAGAQARR